jgi:hypothetical protein
MHTVQQNYPPLPSLHHPLRVTRNKTLVSCSHKFELPIDTFDPHPDRMAKHNLKTFQRF